LSSLITPSGQKQINFEMAKKKKLALHWQIIIGLVAGIIWSLVSSSLGLSAFTIDWIGPFGDIFINLLKLIAIPLVLFSIISGVASLSDIKTLGRMGAKTLGIYLFTTFFAVILGLVLVNLVKPGARASEEQRVVNRISYELWVKQNPQVEVLDDKGFLSNPKYADYVAIAEARLQQSVGDEQVNKRIEKAAGAKKRGPLAFLVDMFPDNIFLSLTDSLMLQIIVFAIFFGLTLVSLPREQVSGLIHVIDGFNAVFIKMVEIVMKAAPFFVFALLAGKLSEMAGNDVGGILEIFKALGWYSLTVTLGLTFLIFVLYPVLVKQFNKELTYRDFFKAMSPAQFLAFSTSSSAATLPITMDCVHNNLGVPRKVTSFVLPIGATVNMDGTSMYQAVAVVFLAQLHWVDLTIAQQVTIVLTAALASIGSAAIPSAGLIMLIIVLESVGLNPAWIAIIFPVDRILDMGRTVVNVTGDAAVSTIVASLEPAISEEA
jgi:Na+/H+-dicarboxylate symporter